jgi:ATP-dependent Zn protease
VRKLRAGRATCDEAIGMMTVYLAGPAAQGSGVGGASDRGKAEAIAVEYAGGDERAARGLVAVARKRAEALVRQHRRAIERVSRALVEKRTLKGRDLAHALGAAS